MTKADRLKLGKLKAQAEKSAKFRGHDISNTWEDGEFSSILQCAKCSAYVQVILKPLPNQIDIGGSAVAIGCESN